MTDEEYFINFLKKNYEVIFFGRGFTIIRKGDRNNSIPKKLSELDVSCEIYKVLGFKPLNFSKIIVGWFNEIKFAKARYLYAYLENYQVELRQTEWGVIDKDGVDINIDELYKAMEPYYNSRIIIDLFYFEWVDNKIIDISTKMIEN